MSTNTQTTTVTNYSMHASLVVIRSISTAVCIHSSLSNHLIFFLAKLRGWENGKYTLNKSWKGQEATWPDVTPALYDNSAFAFAQYED